MIVRMIATGSLSAFSASVLQGTDALGVNPGSSALSGSRSPSGIRPVRVTASLPQAPQPAPPALDLGKSSAAPAGRVPPRGSLLDLSV